jgi:hypothetical protein
MLFDRGRPTLRARIAVGLAATLAILVAAPPVNLYLFRAEPSGVEKSLPIFDLAGIAARTAGPGPATARRCYSPVEWDRSGEPGCPGFALLRQTDDHVARLWLAEILHHPAAYAVHRLGHFDRTMRLFVPAGLPHAVAPVDPEPNRLGLGGPPSAAARLVHRIGAVLAGLPVAWPAFWLALDLVAIWSAVEAPPGQPRTLALALAGSALVMGTSFLVVSVASDLRYHLWTMLASALAWTLRAGAGAVPRRHWLAAAAVALLVSSAGLAGRLLLPPFA